MRSPAVAFELPDAPGLVRLRAPEPGAELHDFRLRALLPEADWASLPAAVRRRFSKCLAAGQSIVYLRVKANPGDVNPFANLFLTIDPGHLPSTNPPGGLDAYYRNNVTGGPNSFVMVAENFNTFGQAILNKLVAEVAAGFQVTIEDPDVFIAPLQVLHRWRRVQGPMRESSCAEGEMTNPFKHDVEPLPMADRPYF